MKIERGIITAEMNNDDVHVRGFGKLYKLNVNSLFERDYKNGETVLGIVIDKKYSVCHEFVLKNGEKLFGYIVNNGFGSAAIRVQIITDFNTATYDPYDSIKEYATGEELVLKKDNLINFFEQNDTA